MKLIMEKKEKNTDSLLAYALGPYPAPLPLVTIGIMYPSLLYMYNEKKD
jgi:hypothetical protein